MGGGHHSGVTDVGKVMPMSIQGRLARERERLLGMSDEERKWRKQWVKDQHLSPNEPRFVPELYSQLNNPIKRAYRMPLDLLFKPLQPILGARRASNVRYIVGKLLVGTYITMLGIYWVKYNRNDWTRVSGWRLTTSKLSVLPGDPGYPSVSTKEADDYESRNFKSSAPL